MNALFDRTLENLQKAFATIPKENRFLLIDPLQFEQINYHYIEFFKKMQIMLLNEQVYVHRIPASSHLVILARNEQIYCIISTILQVQKSYPTTQFHLFISPRLSNTSDSLLRQYNVFNAIQTLENINFDIAQSYDSNCYIFNNNTVEHYLAHASIAPLQQVADNLLFVLSQLGGAERIIARGSLACKTLKIYERIRYEQGVAFNSTAFESVIILDRMSDMITPMLTGYTYCDQISIFLGLYQNKSEAYPLYDVFDTVVYQCKYVNFAQLGDKITNMMNQAKQYIDECKALQNDKTKSIYAISKAFNRYKDAEKTFVFVDYHTKRVLRIQQLRDCKYNEVQMLKKYILVEKSKTFLDTLEALILRQLDCQQACEILALISLACGGLRPKEIQHFRRVFIQNYGATGEQCLNVFSDLLGLVSSNERPQFYDYLTKEYKLVEEKEFDKINTEKPGYCFWGICPLTAKMLLDALPDYSGDVKKKERKIPECWNGFESYYITDSEMKATAARHLVVFIGPLTHSELGSFDCVRRIVGAQKNDFELVALCSQLKSGSEIIKCVLQGY